MRMRTQAEAMTYIREHDPDTALTPWALRTLILTGAIPSVQIGRKRLIDLDSLDAYLVSPAQPASPDCGTIIRPVRLVK